MMIIVQCRGIPLKGRPGCKEASPQPPPLEGEEGKASPQPPPVEGEEGKASPQPPPVEGEKEASRQMSVGTQMTQMTQILQIEVDFRHKMI